MKIHHKTLILILVSMLTSFAYASVFTYNPLTTNISPVAPPVIFKYGGNTGKADLCGTTITVSIGSANTSLTLMLHPTYQKVYYKDVARINNTDTNVYYVKLRVENALNNTNAKIASAKLYLYNVSTDTKMLELNLLVNGTTGWVLMNGKAEWRIDVEIEISESGGSYNAPPFKISSATLKLIYSTQNIENPP
ncbi:MAG: hypothetical protein NDF51_02970 [archaeon YNP-WB-040]|nr:hypothetical protein [Candidatus Culexarchaeum yellowstonense]